MKILFIEDEEHFKGFDINTQPNEVVYGGYWKLSLGLISLTDFDIVISTLQHCNLSRKIIQKSNYLEIVTVLIVDGIFEWNNSYNNDYLKLLGVSLFSENIYDYVYLSSDELIKQYLVGKDEVRYLPFYNKRIFTSQVNAVNNEPKKVNKDRFLISFANTPFFNDEEKLSLYSLLGHLKDSLDDLGIDYDYRVFNSCIISDLKIEKSKNNINSKFKDIANDYSAIISTPSSICLEAMSYNIPVAQLYYRNTPQTFQTAWTIHQGVNVKNTLLDMLSPDCNRTRYQSTIYKQHTKGSIDVSSLKAFKSSAKMRYSKDHRLSMFDIEVYKRLIYQNLKKIPKLKSILKFIIIR